MLLRQRIKLGYANAKIYKCDSCIKPMCYQSTGSHIYSHNCIHCKSPTKLILHVSFTDCPGHNLLMATMLNGTCIMDYTILLESCANSTIPALQTIEHYKVTKEAGIETKFVCLNKTDLLVKEKEKIKDNIERLKDFVDNKIPIVPVCCTLGLNIDVICEYISRIPIPLKKLDDGIKMLVIRSFNVNGKVLGMEEESIFVKLEKPICVELNDKVTINVLKDDSGIIIYGSGIIIDGIESLEY